MATSTPSVTPRLRMSRHSPGAYDQSQTASLSEAGPSRLPDFSQLVNMSLKDMDMSDDNIYASDVPTDHNTEPESPVVVTTSNTTTPATVTRAENPAAVLRALLSRLPSRDDSPTRPNPNETQYPSERESDYDVETASATTSVAQSSLKNIFSKALREPGDTPTKNRTRSRRSSIGASEVEDTPRVVEVLDLKGKRRSLSDDEVENNAKSSTRPRTRFKPTPQPLTRDFLQERFGNWGNSPSKQGSSVDDSGHEIVMPNLDSSQHTPPAATSTPQQSLRMSFNDSKFQSNLLDQNSEMQNAIEGLDSSMDGLSDRSVSPPPTLVVDSEPADDIHVSARHNDIATSTVHSESRTPHARSTRVSPRSNASRTNAEAHNNYDESFGEQSMSLSLPAGHARLQTDLTNRSRASPTLRTSVSRQHSASSLRPTSPIPGHHSHHNPVDPVHERELGWNKHHPAQRSSPAPHAHPHLSHHSSTSSLGPTAVHRPESPVEVVHERERNWNAHHPHRLESPSLHHSHSHSAASSRPSSTSSVEEVHHGHHHRPESPVDPLHDRERNWNSHHPVWHDGASLHAAPVASPHSNGRVRANSFQNTSHNSSHANGHSISRAPSPQPTRNHSGRSLSPLPPNHASPTPSRASSLKSIDNTYQNQQSITRRPARSPSPLPPSRKKADTSSASSVARPKSPAATPSSKAKTKAARSPAAKVSSATIDRTNGFFDHGEVDRSPSQVNGAPPTSTSAFSWPSGVLDAVKGNAELSSNGHVQVRDAETDEMRETDFSSQSETPRSKGVELSEVSDSHDETSEPTAIPKPQTPRILIQDRTPPLHEVSDSFASPSTPPRQTPPKSARVDFKTPSPPRTLPDLPTPSSSDESHRSPVKLPKTPKFGTPHHSKWMQTPKPPGGWLATPKPANQLDTDESVLDAPVTPNPKVWEQENRYPQTPVNGDATQLAAKTPKPPGGWLATPGPASVPKTSESSSLEDDGQRSQLLTPVNSLSKTSALNLKTPGVPGGWAATPAGRKSVLKVRFNPESTALKDETTNVTERSEALGEDLLELRNGSVLPPSPRSPQRRSKSGIRVLDAFGREQEDLSPTKDVSRGFRVLDAMGREIKEEEPSSILNESKIEDTGPAPSRDELLSRLRQGLDTLVGEFDSDDDRDILSPDRARIQELVATSRQSRKTRDKLQSQRSAPVIVNPVAKSSFLSLSWKMCLALGLVQLILLFVMYQLSMARARNYFSNAFYDPFNPELHFYVFKSDRSLYLSHLDTSSTLWPRALLPEGGLDWTHLFGDLQVYLGQLWNVGTQQSRAWPPT